jgi:hypothetical protein
MRAFLARTTNWQSRTLLHINAARGGAQYTSAERFISDTSLLPGRLLILPYTLGSGQHPCSDHAISEEPSWRGDLLPKPVFGEVLVLLIIFSFHSECENRI